MTGTDQAVITWMIRRHLGEVVAIERESFADPWDKDDFVGMLSNRNIIGRVALDAEDRVVGYMVYELNKATIRVENLAVAPAARRQGIGRRMIGLLAAKLSPGRRTRLIVPVRETNLPAQLFLRGCGLRAVCVLRGKWADGQEDEYLFRLSVGSARGVSAGADRHGDSAEE